VERLGHEVRSAQGNELVCTALDAFAPELVITDITSGKRWLTGFLPDEDRRQLCVAGYSERAGIPTTPFDYVLEWPLRPRTLHRLLWLVEVRRISRECVQDGRAPRPREPRTR
jgi:hypothetical protein